MGNEEGIWNNHKVDPTAHRIKFVNADVTVGIGETSVPPSGAFLGEPSDTENCLRK